MTVAVQDSQQFRSSFHLLIEGMSGLLSATTSAPADLCFELAAARERPIEFLQCWLDVLRVVYEPDPPGSLHLNSNWDLMLEAVPAEPFTIGYLTVTGASGEALDDVVVRWLTPKLLTLGYDHWIPRATFICVLCGTTSWQCSGELIAQVSETFGAGWTAETFMGVTTEISKGEVPELPNVVGGVAVDPSLMGDQLRVSILMYR